jgi:hypothetical protein
VGVADRNVSSLPSEILQQCSQKYVPQQKLLRLSQTRLAPAAKRIFKKFNNAKQQKTASSD